jgi:hypothetical protein
MTDDGQAEDHAPQRGIIGRALDLHVEFAGDPQPFGNIDALFAGLCFHDGRHPVECRLGDLAGREPGLQSPERRESLGIPLVLGSPQGHDLIASYLYNTWSSGFTPDPPVVSAGATVMLAVACLLLLLRTRLMGAQARFVSTGGAGCHGSRRRAAGDVAQVGAWRAIRAVPRGDDVRPDRGAPVGIPAAPLAAVPHAVPPVHPGDHYRDRVLLDIPAGQSPRERAATSPPTSIATRPTSSCSTTSSTSTPRPTCSAWRWSRAMTADTNGARHRHPAPSAPPGAPLARGVWCRQARDHRPSVLRRLPLPASNRSRDPGYADDPSALQAPERGRREGGEVRC